MNKKLSIASWLLALCAVAVTYFTVSARLLSNQESANLKFIYNNFVVEHFFESERYDVTEDIALIMSHYKSDSARANPDNPSVVEAITSIDNMAGGIVQELENMKVKIREAEQADALAGKQKSTGNPKKVAELFEESGLERKINGFDNQVKTLLKKHYSGYPDLDARLLRFPYTNPVSGEASEIMFPEALKTPSTEAAISFISMLEMNINHLEADAVTLLAKKYRFE